MPWFGEERQVTPISAAELTAAVLPTTRFREGYAIDEVDQFRAAAVRALEQHEQGYLPLVTADQVLAVRFRATSFERGYDQRAVDDLLDRVALALQRPSHG